MQGFDLAGFSGQAERLGRDAESAASASMLTYG
jgi:hypothetical protein